MATKIVESKVYPLKELFLDKFDVDFYQREYVWQRKHLEDLIMDLSTEFLKSWKQDHELEDVSGYDPYYMGEIVLSLKDGQRSSIIDGQQRITTLTLLLMYLFRHFNHLPFFPDEVKKLIYSDYYGKQLFNLDISERKECMLSLYKNGQYAVKASDSPSIQNLVDRYADISECWNDKIDDTNAVSFIYWIKEKVVFSKVWTNSDEFAYVIFETMNDRGLSLTQVEMLRSYLLANIKGDSRDSAMRIFDDAIKRIDGIKLNYQSSKAKFEFFKIYLRGHYAQDFSQAKNSNSDFVRIGKEFHRWVRDKSTDIGLIEKDQTTFIAFIDRIAYFAKVYERINTLIQARDTENYLYLIVNDDYKFTLQPALILASIAYLDTDEVIDQKIRTVSKYLSKVLSWRVWNHWMISQSSLESPIYDLCKKIRDMSVDNIESTFASEPIDLPALENAPTLNQQNRSRLKVLVSLITEIVVQNSGAPDYMLNKKDIEVEHIWANHFEQHADEFSEESDFASVRNNIGDLLVLPKSFNASYGDLSYAKKVPHYLGQNILAQTLNQAKYTRNPTFLNFVESSGLPFKSYADYKRASIAERAELYKRILLWNWNNA